MPLTENRGLDRDGVSARNEGPAIDAAREFVPDRGCGAETAHERSVRQTRQLSKTLDAQQPKPFDYCRLDVEQSQRQRRKDFAFCPRLAGAPVFNVRRRQRRDLIWARTESERASKMLKDRARLRHPRSRTAGDAVHIEKSQAGANVVNQRRNGI